MMEKRLFLAFSITFLFLIAYSYLISSRYPKPRSSPTLESSALPKVNLSRKEDDKEGISGQGQLYLPEAAIGNFIITYSPTGGYIKKLTLKRSGEELHFKNIGYTPEDKDREFTPEIRESKVIFKSPEGTRKEFYFQGYTIRINLSSARLMVIFSNRLSSNMLDQRYQEFFYFQNGTLLRKPYKKIREGKHKVVFAGARDRYYCLSLLKDSYNVEWVKDKKEVYLYLEPKRKEVSLYVGPQLEKELKPFGLQGIIYYGFFHVIGVVIGKLLHFFYFLTKNWGISIILLATIIYLLLFPFTMKSAKAMKRMQEIQPAVEELKKKYKDNPQKLNKETLELYKKYKINPLGGCLPMFFQLPVFIALYQILFRFLELKNAQFLWIKDLSLPDRLFFVPSLEKIPMINGYINILPILMMILGLIQQKVTTSSTSSSEQKSMGLFFSVFLGVIFYNFPSSLVLYWFTQNILTFTYQFRISKKRVST